MTARHAFMCRDFWVCTECDEYAVGDDGLPRCKRHEDIIRYDPHIHGCASFGIRGGAPERETLYTYGNGHGSKARMVRQDGPSEFFEEVRE